MNVDFRKDGKNLHFRFSDKGEGQFIFWMDYESARRFAHDVLKVLDKKE